MADEKFFMNKQHGAHMTGKAPAGDVDQATGAHHAPHIHFHPHHDESGKHTHTTVHIMHHDGTHTMHEHPAGDTDSMAEHVHRYHGGDGAAPAPEEESVGGY